uniref:Uncharacterized protein n=1 Tax=Anguilla anguilla TaxID=7936 RepID=A0A0E9RPF4_ANGAN
MNGTHGSGLFGSVDIGPARCLLYSMRVSQVRGNCMKAISLSF